MLKSILKASVFATLLLMQLCSGDPLKAAPGQSVGGIMNLGGEVESDLFIDAPTAVSYWTLNPSSSPASRQIALAVTARTCWQISVKSDRQDGRMAQYNLSNSQYMPDGMQLQSPLKILAKGTEDHPDPWEVDLPAGGVIREGEETGGKSQDVEVTLQQPVSWNDEPLPDGQAYRAVLVFTISVAE